MLLKSHIAADVEMFSDQWFAGRLGKFTSSMAYTLMGEKPFTTGAMTYIMERVGEDMTGVSAKQEVDNDSTRWGLLYEPDAIRRFGEEKGVEFLVTQKLVTAPGSRFGSTPDAIWVKNEYETGYEVETAEIKCYPSYGHFIECALCHTPQELKLVDKKLYYQVLDQMDNCQCLRGHAVLFHPLFKAGGYKSIEFRKIELTQDFKLLKERKNMAVGKFEEIRSKLLAA